MASAEILRLVAGACAILALVFLISRSKLHPFPALLMVAVALGAATGLPLDGIVRSFEGGMGAILGHTAAVIALGSMLGKMLAASGAAEVIATTLVGRVHRAGVPWTMLAIGLLLGLPVFFEVGFVILMPVAFTVASETSLPILQVALPMLAGLSVVHGLIPPHPAAVAAVAIYHADLGRTIAFALVVGIPAAVLAGPVYALWISKRVHPSGAGSIAATFQQHAESVRKPGFSITLLTVLLPVLLMLLGGWADQLAHPGTLLNGLLHLFGSGDIALCCGLLLSFWTLGARQGMSRQQMLKLCGEGILPTAPAVLMIGGGGGFGRVLGDAGISAAAMHLASLVHLPLVLTAWLLAAILRVAIGSATVAMTTAATVVAPIAAHTAGARPELLAIATGAGSLILSNVNDGGFWLVGQYLSLDVAQTLATWSVLETILSVAGLALVLALNAF